jgi:pullulanase
MRQATSPCPLPSSSSSGTRWARLAGIAGLMVALAACGGGGGGGGGSPPAPPSPPAAPVSIASSTALWVSQSTIAWPGATSAHSYKLYSSASGAISVSSAGVTGFDATYDLGAPAALDGSVTTRFPQLAGTIGLAVPAAALPQVGAMLRGQVVVVDFSGGVPVSATQPQIQGVLDDLYATTAAAQKLGLSFATDHTPTFRLWAPTATNVQVTIDGGAHAMSFDSASGVWSYVGAASQWNTSYYTYAVQVYSRADGSAIHTYTVTDPYAPTLDADHTHAEDANQQHAMVADLDSAAMKPATWDAQPLPAQLDPHDVVLYELHVRDFSANDTTVPAADRGKYLAFSDTAANGMQHLAQLAAAGVTHVHLLPAFDIASIDESGCTTPAISNVDPAGDGPATIQAATDDTDCFNWGYDPKNFNAPEGSYSSDAAHGEVRVKEFRAMVQSLHATGLSVVMDVVYNHMSSNYLDQIVPGYYYRLNADGSIQNTSCCSDVAPEFAMVEKLMTDTLVNWAVEYKVDGFRFDIMSDIPLAVLERAKVAVGAAVAAASGGTRTSYWYGEGWANSTNRFVPAQQLSLAGSGIGSFNDRMRDTVRGGGPFDSGGALVSNTGFLEGTCSNCDLIRVAMAGGVRDVDIGSVLSQDVDYFGQPAAYASDPQEVVNYVGCHDNETLWDISQYKHATSVSSADRARAQVVGIGTVLVSEGVPFIHAGDELLRSKGFDKNSYNSGDWFNRIDWTATTNYLGAGAAPLTMGLPPAADNSANYATMTPILGNPLIAPSAVDIAHARDAVLDLLKVRRDTALLRLRSGAQVKACVSFPDETSPVNGMVVMKLDGVACSDPTYKTVLVMANGTASSQSISVPALNGHTLVLHPDLASGSDAVVKTTASPVSTGAFTVPARTVAVMVEN